MNKANLGQGFENVINLANEHYKRRNVAIVEKVPTPFKIVRSYNPITKRREVTGAFPEKKSICDYIGIAAGNFLAFEAKSTENKTNFPLKELKDHQRAFLNAVYLANAVCFVLIECKTINKVFRLMWDDLKRFEKEHDRKSIPFIWLQEFAYEVPTENGYLHYLKSLTLYNSYTGAYFLED